MSVIVKNIQTDKIELYCKEADCKISSLLVKDKSIYLNSLNELKNLNQKD